MQSETGFDAVLGYLHRASLQELLACLGDRDGRLTLGYCGAVPAPRPCGKLVYQICAQGDGSALAAIGVLRIACLGCRHTDAQATRRGEWIGLHVIDMEFKVVHIVASAQVSVCSIAASVAQHERLAQAFSICHR